MSPPPTEVTPATARAPISPELLRELELARQRGGRIRRAVGVALFNGWAAGVFAVISLLCGVFSRTGLLLGIALAVVAYNEFSGANMLRRLDQRAPRRLGFNQLGFCGVLVTYSLWSIYSALTGPSPYASTLASGGQVAEILGPIEHLYTTITLTVYGSLIFFSIIFQGGTAWYYFTRGRYIRAYVNETPPWVVELERTAGSM